MTTEDTNAAAPVGSPVVRPVGRLVPERASACGLRADGMTSDEACRFAVWWAHNRKTFTTTRQAAWAAWTEARNKTPNVRANLPP